MHAESVARRENLLVNLRDMIHDLTLFVLCCASPEVGVRREAFAQHRVVKPHGASPWSMVSLIHWWGFLLGALRSLDLGQQAQCSIGRRKNIFRK